VEVDGDDVQTPVYIRDPFELEIDSEVTSANYGNYSSEEVPGITLERWMQDPEGENLEFKPAAGGFTLEN
jgi:hypothetical protein